MVALGGAMAATVLTQTFTANPGAVSSGAFTVDDNPLVAGPTTASTSAVSITPVALSQFNPTTGILVGARVSAVIPVTITTQVYGIGGNGNRTVNGTTTYVGGVSATGVSATSAATALSLSHSCNGNNCVGNDAQNGNNSNTSGAATYSASGTVAPGSLSSYYGTNTTGVQIATGGTLTVSSTGGGNLTSAFTRGIVNRTAGSSYSVAYDYLNFSSPSFDGSTVVRTFDLNFGTIHQANGLATLDFTLFNIGNANSAGFDLVSLGRDGNALFTTTLAPFSGQANNIDGGQSRTFSVSVTPTTLGSKVEQFRLALRDSAVDVGTGGLGAKDFDMTLNVFALVLPEPGTWLSMIIGFGLIGSAARRQRRAGLAAA